VAQWGNIYNQARQYVWEIVIGLRIVVDKNKEVWEYDVAMWNFS
jgi:hypothetical protein